jgi:hypothetical protein
MAKVNVVNKTINMSLDEIIKFQMITYSYINKLTLSEADLSCITILALNKKVEISDFCNACCVEDNRDKEPTTSFNKVIFKTPQTVRNCITKLMNYNIIVKERTGASKYITLNPDFKIQNQGNILLNYKIVSLES